MNHSTRASTGYRLHGIALHDTLQAHSHLRHQPRYDGGLTLVSWVLLVSAFGAAFVVGVDVLAGIWPG